MEKYRLVQIDDHYNPDNSLGNHNCQPKNLCILPLHYVVRQQEEQGLTQATT